MTALALVIALTALAVAVGAAVYAARCAETKEDRTYVYRGRAGGGE